MDVEVFDLSAIFGRALEFEAGPAREAYLYRACFNRPALWAEVEDLLRAHDQAGAFLEGRCPDLGSRTDGRRTRENEQAG